MLNSDAARLDWILDGTPDREGLEQFAISITALANNEATPLAILENVLTTIAENLNASSALAQHDAQTVLSNKAAALGYDNVQEFRREVIEMIARNMMNVEYTGLTPTQRLIHKKYSLR